MNIVTDQIARMVDCVLARADRLHVETPIPRLSLNVMRRMTPPLARLSDTTVSLVLQGAKEVVFGNHTLRYGAGTCFGVAIEMHTMGCVVEANEAAPYVSASISLNRDLLTALMTDLQPAMPNRAVAAFGAIECSPALLGAWDGLLSLLDFPDDIAFLAASRERELLYRLVRSAHGPMLWQFVDGNSNLSRIQRAINWMRLHFDQAIRTESLAQVAAMSVPSFHRHFKAATAMTPLQYQKALRLEVAKRLLLTNANVMNASCSVGYESATQFSREYSRAFGFPPSQTVRAVAKRRKIAL